MTILIDATIECNIDCDYCYNKPMRMIEHPKLDLPALLKAMESCKGGNFALHGGEPLTLPLPVLEKILAECYLLTNKGSIQTNGTLITDEHISLFGKYNTTIGVSFDGFGKLNRFRGGDPNKIWKIILKLQKSGIGVGLLTVISRANGLPQQRQQMKKFLKTLQKHELSTRLLPCCHENSEIQLTIEEAVEFYDDMLDFCMANGMYGISPFSDALHALRDEWDKVWCRFVGCDPFSTPGGIVITADGQLTNCHKFETVQYSRGQFNSMRANSLHHTDCKDCPWFQYCRGGCPGDAIDFDWRNKTRWCPVYQKIFSKLNGMLKFQGLK